MAAPLFLLTLALVAGLTLRSIWRNPLELGSGAALCFAFFCVSMPTPLPLRLITAWLVCVWPWKR